MRLVAEYLEFLRRHKWWWIVPLLLATLLVVALALLAERAGPFTYPRF